ncbi:hypothetical protein ASF71_14520 [Deinococcus sp. Leaf326]|nr:hypothetical protein ASF71_14520 [Deinococcus sp. Leaf326]
MNASWRKPPLFETEKESPEMSCGDVWENFHSNLTDKFPEMALRMPVVLHGGWAASPYFEVVEELFPEVV